MPEHKSATMTLDTYADLFDDDLDDVADALSRARAAGAVVVREVSSPSGPHPAIGWSRPGGATFRSRSYGTAGRVSRRR
jgi:hypothetical protein